jgi:hypothetical protein
MTKSFTIPYLLTAESRSLCEWSVEELLEDPDFEQSLHCAFDDVLIAAPERAVKNALAYSASHQVHRSEMLQADSILFLN